jgi:hypothetical protein
LTLTLVACGGDNSVSPTPAYDANAVSHVLAAMIADKEFLAPNGGPVKPEDQQMLLKIVQEACKGPGKIQAMIQTLGANPYLLSVAMKLANTGCPKLISDMGIQVNE